MKIPVTNMNKSKIKKKKKIVKITEIFKPKPKRKRSLSPEPTPAEPESTPQPQNPPSLDSEAPPTPETLTTSEAPPIPESQSLDQPELEPPPPPDFEQEVWPEKSDSEHPETSSGDEDATDHKTFCPRKFGKNEVERLEKLKPDYCLRFHAKSQKKVLVKVNGRQMNVKDAKNIPNFYYSAFKNVGPTTSIW